MKPDGKCPDTVEQFINAQVISRGLDERTAIAYRMDLEKFYLWPEAVSSSVPGEDAWEDQMEERMETYLEYLSRERGLRYSTISRKQKVFSYYLSYLVSRGILKEYRPLKPVEHTREAPVDTLLTKWEVEAFFRAIDREYEDLDSDFRRRICLRDQVMMKLLFYHGLDISELLQLELSDYNRKTATLVIRRKRQEDYSVYLFSRMLQQQMEQWLSEHVYFEHGGMYHNRMFLSKLGKPLSMKMVINIFDKYRELAGIEKVCKPKDLKNSLGRYAEEVVRELG
ncbi:MAG: tyrosine-type recombinase/integrase [Lachnospiraceae bacterium]|nr:tyrosine-type recombinase/integrase [Lachnospiraceae bacterium]